MSVSLVRGVGPVLIIVETDGLAVRVGIGLEWEQRACQSSFYVFFTMFFCILLL